MKEPKSWISNLSLRAKFYILIGAFCFSIVLLGIVSVAIFRSNQTITILATEHRVFIEHYNAGVNNYYRYELVGAKEDLQKSIENFEKAEQIAWYFAVMDSVLETMPKQQWKPLLYDVYKEGVDYNMKKIRLVGNHVRLFSRISPGMLKASQEISNEASQVIRQVLNILKPALTDSVPIDKNLLESRLNSVPELTRRFTTNIYQTDKLMGNLLMWGILLSVFVIATLVLFFARQISHSIVKPIKNLTENFKNIAKGSVDFPAKSYSGSEIGELSKALVNIQARNSMIIQQAQKVAQGDYSARLQPASDHDNLIPALNQMAEKLEENKNVLEKENWMEKGIHELDNQLMGNFTVRELSDRILLFMSRFLQIEMGAMYVYDEVLNHLELTGSIGLNTENVKKIIQIGEGLIGNAAKSPECQIIDAKDRFQTINSATGEIIPAKIYLVSIYFDNRIQAVMELAPVQELSELKIEFLKQAKESLAVNLNAAVSRFRSKELLDQTVAQAEELKARDKELRQKLEENQRIRENLSRETALLNSMLKTLPDYVYFKDTESRFLRISESMVSLFGARTSDEIIGKSDFDYHPPKDAKRYYDEEQEIIRKGEGFVDEIRQGVDENGDELWTSVTKLPMFDKSGKCIGTFGISKDITKIKQLEIQVKEQYEKLLQSQEELKAANEELHAQEEELRVANEELEEKTKILIENEKHLQAQQEELRVANEELEQKTQLLEIQKNEIQIKNHELEKISADLVRKARELELASQYKSEFLANMSHELRTPLNSMLILSKLLRDNKNKNLTEEQLKSVSIIYNSGKDLLELINEILDLSKIEAGKMHFDFDEVLTSEIASEIRLNFTPVAENKKLSLKIEQENGFPEKLFTDRQRFMQIIKNLLSNAFKFTSAGGVTVKFGMPAENTKFVRPELHAGNTCFVAVEDTGVGIPQNKVDEIFEAFHQADGIISRKFGGTGLGLSISKQIIRKLGGEIHVESTEGVGSVFTVYLPLDRELVGKDSEETAKPAEKSKSSPPDEHAEPHASMPKPELPFFVSDDRNSGQNKMTVMIIHNDPQKTEKLIGLCHGRDFNAIAASNIQDGIVLAEKFNPQAIILSAELDVESESGKLSESKITSHIPVHVVSRIEQSVIDDIGELVTPESGRFNEVVKNIESKISNQFRRVLIVEDDWATRVSMKQLFENRDIILQEATTAGEAFQLISENLFDCIILDLGLPDYSGMELLDKLSRQKIPIPHVIVNTAKDLSAKELRELHKYSDSIVIKGIKSEERLMDEVTLFLHQVTRLNTRETTDNDASELLNTGFRDKKVLIVDDDIRNVFAMAQILEERGIKIMEAENGQVAIEMLKNNPDIDLVLMDVMMPVMDGYEAIKNIRNTPGIENVPIITLTAKAMKEDYQKAIDAGANDFISKPVDVDKLISLLKIWLFK